MKSINVLLFALLVSSGLLAQRLTPVDDGSKVHFTIKNFGIKTGGDFTGLKGAINFNPTALSNSNINVSVNANSVNTDNEARDKHLKKDDYFDVEKYPLITFISTKITESTVAGRFFVIGNLTIKGITKSVQFGFTAVPITNGYKFNGSFDINRRDFGVGGSSAVLADKLSVTLDIFAKK